jgi:biotin transport system ATP-binding protein
MGELFRLAKLCHRFADGQEGLFNIDLSIKEGDFLVLAGKNGSGKTLLAKHCLGLSRPSSGEILFRGQSLRNSLSQARREVGFVFEQAEAQVIGQSVMEDVCFGPANLRLAPAEIERRAAAALAAVGLGWARERLCDSLSGGERRRLAIAGILAMEANCLILDEPFANLDAEAVREVVGCLIGLHQAGKTIVVLTHELEKILGEANRLVVMGDGKILFDGKPEGFPPAEYEKAGLMNPFRSYQSVRDLTWKT